MRRLLIAAGLVCAFATGVYADKVVNRIYFAVVLSDVEQIRFFRDANAAQGWTIEAAATVRASDGAHYRARVYAPATAGQKTAIENFASSHVVPAVNAQEGL